MPSHTPSLPVLLRRRRSLLALALFALLFKMLASTICLADGVSLPSATTEKISVAMSVATLVDVAANDDNPVCPIAEKGGCHCACAHSLPLPSSPAPWVDAPAFRFDRAVLDSPRVAVTTGSLLRPPIA
ncbi:MAG: hypothetical protein JSR65_04415 [Proteobacteria bacterium]|nr:hypothetical protein [Pseudomonadota bacterium]